MSYDIHITRAAERDLLNAADHIEFVLKNPKAADDLLDEAEKQINSLGDFSEKFRLLTFPAGIRDLQFLDTHYGNSYISCSN